MLPVPSAAGLGDESVSGAPLGDEDAASDEYEKGRAEYHAYYMNLLLKPFMTLPFLH